MEDRLENLKKATCYGDTDGIGYKSSKWINLSKFDVEWAAWEIERLRMEKNYAHDIIDSYKSEVSFKDAEIERLRNALQKICDFDAYDVDRPNVAEYMQDVARAAIQQKESE